MNILYICTHNRCRSILSEAITNHLGQGRLHAVSAGSQPAGQVHPLTLRYLEASGIPVQGLHSKSWDDIAADEVDLVVTVCDSAANEACPVWFGKTPKIHWGLQDPSKVDGSEQEQRAAFLNIIQQIQQRVIQLLDLNLDQIPKDAWGTALNRLVEEN